MGDRPYDTLAHVYDWLVPDAAHARSRDPHASLRVGGPGRAGLGRRLRRGALRRQLADPRAGTGVPGADGAVETHGETLSFWPFTHEELDADLRHAGLAPAASTYAPDVERYLVTARRRTDRRGDAAP
jgi:hypothetical protein